jgi:hypothetical protein
MTGSAAIFSSFAAPLATLRSGLAISLVLLLGFPQTLVAYSYLTYQNSLGRIGVFAWSVEDLPIPLIIDRKVADDASGQLRQSIDAALATWPRIAGSCLSVRERAFTNEPLSAANFDDSSPYFKMDREFHEIALDSDGSMIEYLGLDPAAVTGIGLPLVEGFFFGDDEDFNGRIIDGFVLLNQLLLHDGLMVENTLIHEIGHFFGLGHSMISPAFRDETIPLPIMYPFYAGDDMPHKQLTLDDQAAIRSLYPEADFEQNYGRLGGTVVRPNDQGVFGGVVLATDSTGQMIAGFSGYASGLGGRGEFSLSGLPPGNYEIRLFPLNSGDTGLSPQNFPYIFSELENDFPAERYNDQPLNDQAEPKWLSVQAGKTTDRINFITGPDNPTPEPEILDGAWPDLPYATNSGRPVGGFCHRDPAPSCGCSLNQRSVSRPGRFLDLGWLLVLCFILRRFLLRTVLHTPPQE